MISNINETPLRAYADLPTYYKARPTLINYHRADPAMHYEDGWREIITPNLDPKTEKLGSLIFDKSKDTVTYAIEPRSKEDLLTDI